MRHLKRLAKELCFSGKVTRLNRSEVFEIGLFLTMFVFSLSLNFATQRYGVANTDINQTDLFSNLLLRNRVLKYSNPLNEKYAVPIFGIRGLLNFGENYYVPSVLPGMIILQTTFKSVNLPTFLVNPIFVLIGLWFFNKTTNIFVFKKTFWSFSATAIYFSSGAFIFVSSLPFKDLIATSTFFAGLYYILNGIYEKKTSDFALFGFFAGITMWMNYLNVIFFLPALGLYLLTIRSKITKRVNLMNLMISCMFFLPFFISLYVYQVTLYGGFLAFNDPVLRLNHYEEFSVQRSSIYDFILNMDITNLLTNFYNQFLLVSQLLVFLGLLGFLVIFIDTVKGKKLNRVLIVLLITVALQFFFYLGKTWSGVSLKGSVGTSYSRYLLISWGVIVIFAVSSIRRLVDWLRVGHVLKRGILALLLAFLILSGLTTGLTSKMAVASWIDTTGWTNEFKKDIAQNTPEKSVIFTSFYDKFVYPARQTAVYVAIPEGERMNKTLFLMRELLEDGYSVYMVYEEDAYAISPALEKDAFERSGLQTEQAFSSVRDTELYRVTLMENSSD